METKRDNCEVCMKTITNPICAECYLKHINYWLKDFELDRIQMSHAIKRIKQSLPQETLNEHTCIICGKERISVCMYCAFLGSSKIILKLNAPKEIVNNYFESSNFEIEENEPILKINNRNITGL